MQNIYLHFPLILTLLAMGSQSMAKQNQILFLGSSSTYYHNMPKQVAYWINGTSSFGDVSYHWAGEAGTWTYKYLEPGYLPKSGLPAGYQGSILDYIRNTHYKWISLQVALGDWEEWEKAIPRYAEAAKDAGSQLLLYEQGWKPTSQKALDKSPLVRIAKEHGLVIVPCASAWDIVRKDYPQWDLQDSYYNQKKGFPTRDATHPGLVGNYLNQACFVASIMGRNPEGFMLDNFYHHSRMAHPKSVPFIPHSITFMEAGPDGHGRFKLEPELGKYLRNVAWEAVQKTLSLQNAD